MRYCATIGFFDGVHRGHHFLINQLIATARAHGLSSLIVTFSSHPRNLTLGVHQPLLLTHDERQAYLHATPVDRVVELDFSQVRHLSAKDFMTLLHDHWQVDILLMGYDHRFGCDCLTNFSDYLNIGQQVGIQVLAAAQSPGDAISSTRIRQALMDGKIDLANLLLGYPYTLTGSVIHGRHIGTQLGFPTANLMLPPDKLIPCEGVYAACVETQKALVNIGSNPTFGTDSPISVEVHIPDFEGNLYGQTLSVQFLQYLRPDRRFDSQQQLVNQIKLDLCHLDQITC